MVACARIGCDPVVLDELRRRRRHHEGQRSDGRANGDCIQGARHRRHRRRGHPKRHGDRLVGHRAAIDATRRQGQRTERAADRIEHGRVHVDVPVPLVRALEHGVGRGAVVDDLPVDVLRGALGEADLERIDLVARDRVGSHAVILHLDAGLGERQRQLAARQPQRVRAREVGQGGLHLEDHVDGLVGEVDRLLVAPHAVERLGGAAVAGQVDEAIRAGLVGIT